MTLSLLARGAYHPGMGLGDFHRHRQWASAFALVGILLYTALIPGHVVSQATARALTGEPGAAALEMPCHSGAGVAHSHDPGAPAEPSTPQKKCPFCKGYAAFMTALAGACDAGALDAERATLRFTAADSGRLEHTTWRPNNRGPPLEL